jgi:outer membrane protein assembly factor BamB
VAASNRCGCPRALLLALLIAGSGGLGAQSTADGPGASEHLRWRYVSGGQINGKPALDHRGGVYVASADRALYALLPSGYEKWHLDLGGRPSASPVIAYDGSIYVGTERGQLLAVAPNGRLRWRFRAGSGPCLTPALGRRGNIYLPAGGGLLYALDYAGREQWRFQARADLAASPAVAEDGTIYFCSQDRRLYALTAAGEKLWEQALDEEGGVPALGPGGIVVVAAAGIRAFSAAGSLLWHYGIPARTADPVIRGDGVILAGAENGKLYALDTAGEQLWVRTLGEPIRRAAAVAGDGSLFVAAAGGRVFALTGAGRVQWVFRAKQDPGPPALAEDGTVYAGAQDWILYSLTGGHGGPDKREDAWPLLFHDRQHSGRSNGLADLDGPAAMALRELAAADSLALKYRAVSDIEEYMRGERYLGVHVSICEEILADLATAGTVRRSLLHGRLVNDYPPLRAASCRVLGELATDGAREVLVRILEEDSDRNVRLEALAALAAIGPDPGGKALNAVAGALAAPAGDSELFVLSALRSLRALLVESGLAGTAGARPAVVEVLTGLNRSRYSLRVKRAAREIIDLFAAEPTLPAGPGS